MHFNWPCRHAVRNVCRGEAPPRLWDRRMANGYWGGRPSLDPSDLMTKGIPRVSSLAGPPRDEREDPFEGTNAIWSGSCPRPL